MLGGKATPRSLPRITLMVMKPEKWRAGRGEGASGAGGMEAGLVPKGRAGSLRYWSHPRLDCGGGHVTRTDEAQSSTHTHTKHAEESGGHANACHAVRQHFCDVFPLGQTGESVQGVFLYFFTSWPT